MPRDGTRRFPVAPFMSSTVVREGPQRLCTAATAAGALPAFTWLRLCRLFPPDICVLLPPAFHLQPSCHPGWCRAPGTSVGAARERAGSPPGAANSVAILPHMCPAPVTAVGRSVPRREGADKVTGRARYTDDITVPGAWYGRTIRSTIARGAIRSITLDPAFDWARVVVVTADDIPGDNVVQLIRDDQPILARKGGEIRHKEEPILLLAAADRDTLEEAISHLRIEYDTAEPIFALDQATDVFSTVEITKGEVVEGLKDLDGVEVVERTFRVGLQEQLYIEPQGAIAIPEAGGTIRIIGSLQCPYYVHRALKRALKPTDQQAVVVQAETGGGFGGKEEYPSIVAVHAALLARKAGRPVRLIYDRHEDLAATTKRHPGVIRHRTGVKKDGTLVFQDIEIVLDGGAYCTLTPVVLSRAAIHATGAYSCPNVRIRARADATFRILTASTEIGQGTKTIFCQLAADALGVGLDMVTLAPQDTSLVPDSGPTVASRTAMIVGRLVQQAATELKERLKREKAPLRVDKSYIQPDAIHGDETTYRGDAYPVYAWACTIADVDVDMTTGEVRVTDLVTAVDCGKALHPVIEEGPVEGGCLQAVGWATIEEIKIKDGGYQNDRLATQRIPTALDAPRIRTILVENPYSRGPFGAKGIGELPRDGPAPAIIAGSPDATRGWLDEIPATPQEGRAACASHRTPRRSPS